MSINKTSLNSQQLMNGDHQLSQVWM